jgi:NADPH:quinone reductase-like Zn-dependent oxidoreductase
MRVVNQQAFGGPEVLELQEADRPKGLPTEVVVRVRAVGLNPVEAHIRSGAFPLLGNPPFILGWDISGVVEEVVPGVNRFKVGDEVYGMPFFPRQAAAYAEYVAALPLAGLTAYQSLVDVAQLGPGQRVLIHGAGGGVGHLAVQIAKARGGYVIATASAAKHEFVQSLGADEVIDYQAVDFAQNVADVDVVLETVGRGYAERSLRTLRPGGLLVTIVERTNVDLAKKTTAEDKLFAGVTVEPDQGGLEKLSDLVKSGRLRIHVEHTFPLDHVVKAHELLSGSARGKIVLVL